MLALLAPKAWAIRSNFGSASVERLGNHDWKLYKVFKEAIVERAKASQGGKATDATIFARHVAKKVLSPRPPRQIMFGHMTGEETTGQGKDSQEFDLAKLDGQ
uniref:NADPH-dependent 1-acyldihydroxyacetone phosphate reductase-like n=1 Tax=Populus alba TaxID=43335 RepID=A0A4U5QRS9_POPAL|nr:NADPH-dependent 1-acyldihydroxyacetone phosphate reductase-like [Populus alba]